MQPLTRSLLRYRAVCNVSRCFSAAASSEWQLSPLSNYKRPKKTPVLVAVLDGVGIGPEDDFNAVHVANTPCLDKLISTKERFIPIAAHGTAVGLPTDDDMGNSEVGHNALGAGRIIEQGAKLVDSALASGSIWQGEGWKYLKEAFVGKGGALHIIGLLSDGGVHSRLDQILGLIEAAARDGAKKIRLHVLLDGRDVPDRSAPMYIEQLEQAMDKLNAEYSDLDARVASGGGRMCTTMDRYNADWSIVERGWQAHVLGKAPHTFTSTKAALDQFYSDPEASDQYLDSFVIVDQNNRPVGTIEDGDAVVCANFRGDRVIEISQAFEQSEDEFDRFDRERVPQVHYAGMMQYDGDAFIPANYLVNPPTIAKTSGEWLAYNGIKTFAVSETQKFGHVTYFWNGNRSGYFSQELEKYVEVESDRLEFNQAPKMKAKQIADLAVEAIESGEYDMVRLNFANGDMVGHTGDMTATVEGMEEVDIGLQRCIDAVENAGGSYIVVADHGNADQMAQKKNKQVMLDADGKYVPLTSHTLAPVPFAIGGPALPQSAVVHQDVESPGLANVTASFINLLGFEAPQEYEPSLIKFE